MDSSPRSGDGQRVPRIVPDRTADDDAPACETPRPMMRPTNRLDWAALLRRVFGDTDPTVTTTILEHLGVRSELPRLAPARARPDPAQAELDLGC